MRKLCWPPQSPDQNPIESVWEMMLRSVRSRKQKQPSSLAELREALREVCKIFPQEQIRMLYKGLPSRVNEIRKMKGNATKY